jgi:glycerol kinase
MSLLVAIDQGTTSTRTVAFDRDLNVMHSEQKEYLLKYPKDGWVEI